MEELSSARRVITTMRMLDKALALKSKGVLPYPIDFYSAEEPMTAKESMLRGRPDLLKETWRRKNKR
ncbi:hypothetical protein CPT_MTx_085 [Serratia phage MTx]|uniref:Uncharacterized protein n=1 Tax=Serratia phage MTx TaxID=2557553 RepID=A0A482MG41_9CAUD|nr:hypothetical protein HWC15_gp085 [Serratia phage MTx]QBQ72391.1 hypothetical protein CPT_MTx_085 [Serratia phage MTx]